jgi:hypothetical protein
MKERTTERERERKEGGRKKGREDEREKRKRTLSSTLSPCSDGTNTTSSPLTQVSQPVNSIPLFTRINSSSAFSPGHPKTNVAMVRIKKCGFPPELAS